MSEHEVNLIADEGIFRGLAKQNLLFHQCVLELCDNAIASAVQGIKPCIEIFLNPTENEPDYVDFWICDNGCGMDIDSLSSALQLGKTPTSDSRLNEHGFGLKNALATMSGGNGRWTLWTRKEGKTICSVKGPFSSTMIIEDGVTFPDEPFLPSASDISTIIHVRIKLSFVQGVQGRGAPSNNLVTLRQWLIEHLGVAYRGYLELNKETQETYARIAVSCGTDRKVVPAVNVPLGNAETRYFDIPLAGMDAPIRVTYMFGTLDEIKRDQLIGEKEKAKYYYQGNMPTQGIDIRLGKRVIATAQFESIWKTDDGRTQLSRHNNYNDFVGEVLIPELPRGILTTVNNKTDFNLDDSNWNLLFEELNKIRPPVKVRERTENELKKKWMAMLRATNPEDIVTDERAVWPMGARIDVFRKSAQDESVTIYELKVGSGAPIHLYQLKMYWDGLLLDGIQPREAILLVGDYNSTLEEMANLMNTLEPPKLSGGIKSKPYNFKIEKHSDKGL